MESERSFSCNAQGEWWVCTAKSVWDPLLLVARVIWADIAGYTDHAGLSLRQLFVNIDLAGNAFGMLGR